MGQYKELVHKLPEEKPVMENLTDITDEFIESIKITHPQKYNNFIEKVKSIVDDGHFTEEELKEIDGHFKLEDTTNYAEQNYDIDFSKEHFNKYDFNYVINELYKIYNPIYGEAMDKYTELALSWLDYHKGKALEYYKKNK